MTADCRAQVARMPPWCQHEQVYEVEVYQPGTREWLTLPCCTPCTATLRTFQHGPGGDPRQVRAVRLFTTAP